MMTAFSAEVSGAFEDRVLNLGEAGMTVLTGVVVVFAMLILLTLVFYLFGKIMAPKEKGTAKEDVKPAEKPTVHPAKPVAAAPVAADDECEIAAVIAAAVSAMAPAGVTYTVQDIAPAAAAAPAQGQSVYMPRRRRSAWSASGLSQNVLPF